MNSFRGFFVGRGFVSCFDFGRFWPGYRTVEHWAGTDFASTHSVPCSEDWLFTERCVFHRCLLGIVESVAYLSIGRRASGSGNFVEGQSANGHSAVAMAVDICGGGDGDFWIRSMG